MHHRRAGHQRCVVEQVPTGEVVGAVDHDVVLAQQFDHVAGVEAHVVGHHVHVGVQQREGLFGRIDLAVADALDVVQDLALQVGGVHGVHVDDADGAHPGRSQVERRR